MRRSDRAAWIWLYNQRPRGRVTTPVTTPINNPGLFWLLPPETTDVYTGGLRILSGPWNHSHGWGVSGTPAQLASSPPIALLDDRGAPQRGINSSRGRRGARLRGSERRGGSRIEALRVSERRFGRDWTRIDYGDLDQVISLHLAMHLAPPPYAHITCCASDLPYGDLDQGFFLYVLHFRLGTAFRLSGLTRHIVMHYVSGPQKPWLRALGYLHQARPLHAHAHAHAHARAHLAHPVLQGAVQPSPWTQSACSWDNLHRHAYLRAAGLPLGSTSSECSTAFRRVLTALDAHFAADDAAACCARFSNRTGGPPTSRGGSKLLSVF